MTPQQLRGVAAGTSICPYLYVVDACLPALDIHEMLCSPPCSVQKVHLKDVHELLDAVVAAADIEHAHEAESLRCFELVLVVRRPHNSIRQLMHVIEV